VLSVHDFFEPQPQKKAAIYFLKHVLHNWSDENCVKILTRLRESADESTRLVLMESLISHSCHTAGEEYATPAASHVEAPKPLLANFGAVNEMGYILDMIVSPAVSVSGRKLTTSFLDVHGSQLARTDIPYNGFAVKEEWLEDCWCSGTGV